LNNYLIHQKYKGHITI